MFVTLTGDNSYGLRAELNKLTHQFIAKYGELSVERIDCEEVELSDIKTALASAGLFAENKLVILNRPANNKQLAEDIEEITSNMPNTIDLILVEPSLDKRGKLYKYLSRESDFRSFTQLDANGLASWLQQAAKQEGGSLGYADAKYLVERVGLSQQLLSKELEKLLIHGSHITKEDINELTERSPQSTIFQLLDAAFAGNLRHTLTLYEEQREMRIEPPQIIAMLAWQLYILAVIKAAGDKTADNIAKEAKISPFVLNKSRSIASRLTYARLKQLIHDLQSIDVSIKSRGIDADEALSNYLITINQSA